MSMAITKYDRTGFSSIEMEIKTCELNPLVVLVIVHDERRFRIFFKNSIGTHSSTAPAQVYAVGFFGLCLDYRFKPISHLNNP